MSGEPQSLSPIENLPWDTSFWGFPVARVRGDSLNAGQSRDIDEACAQQNIRCLYFLCGLNDPQSTFQAEVSGYHFADIRMTFLRNLDNHQSLLQQNLGVRRAASADQIALQELAGLIHQDTRFYYDSHFPRPLTSNLYQTWIKVSLDEASTQVFVAIINDTLAGYITCSAKLVDDDQSIGQIGLVGVASSFQGQGIGSALLTTALKWFQERDLLKVTVVTQGRNYGAQRLYQKHGFMTHAVQLWYHKWFNFQR